MSKPTISVLFVLVLISTALMSMNSAPLTTYAAGEEMSQIHLPLVAHRAAPVPDPYFFGTQVYGLTTPDIWHHNALIESGAQTIRNHMPWNMIEPVDTDPSNFNWARADASLYIARQDATNLRTVVTLSNNPTWASPGTHLPLYDFAYDDFVEFITALVERYDGDGIDDAPGSPIIHYLELYNEPDKRGDAASSTAAWGDEPEKYAFMMSKAYEAAKAANPGIKVAFGGIAYDFNQLPSDPFIQTFFADVLNALRDGGYSCGYCFDTMNVHSYPSFNHIWTDSQGPGLYEKVDAVRDVLAQHNLRSVEMIITEAGWHSNTTPNAGFSDQEIQARYVVELFTESRAASVSMMTWWMLYDINNYPFDNGLITLSLEQKSAFQAFEYAIEALKFTIPTRVLPDSETGDQLIDAYEFSYSHIDETLVVAWVNPVTSSETKSLTLKGETATVKNIYGDTIIQQIADADDGRSDGQITVEISAAPLYIEITHD